MILDCDLRSFRDAFSRAAAAAPARSPRVVLQSVLLEARDGVVTLAASDLTFGVRLVVPQAACDRDGSVLLHADRTRGILAVAAAPDGRLRIAVDDGRARLAAGKGRWDLATEDAVLHPGVPAAVDGPAVELDGPDLARGLGRVVHACDALSTRYALGGVCVQAVPDGGLVLVATDGRRLASQEVPAVIPAGLPAAPVVPERVCKFLAAALAESGPCRMAFPGGNRIVVEADGLLVAANLTEGRFVAWRDCFPSGPPGHRHRLPADALRSLAMQATVAASEESQGIDLRFRGDTLLAFGPGTGEVGTGEAEMAIEPDGDCEVTVNGRWLAEALATVRGLEIDLALGEHAHKEAIVFRADGLAYVLMPLSRTQ